MNEPDQLFAIGAVLYIAFILFMIGLALAFFAFWIWMLIDCLKHEKDQGNDKIIWVLVLIFLNWIGALLYYFIRRKERLTKQPKAPTSP